MPAKLSRVGTAVLSGASFSGPVSYIPPSSCCQMSLRSNCLSDFRSHISYVSTPERGAYFNGNTSKLSPQLELRLVLTRRLLDVVDTRGASRTALHTRTVQEGDLETHVSHVPSTTKFFSASGARRIRDQMRTENDSSNFPCGKNSKIRRRFSSRALLSRSCVLDAHAPAVSYPFHPSSLLPAGSTVIAFAYPAPPSLCSTQRLRWHSRGATLGMCAEHVRRTCARSVCRSRLSSTLSVFGSQQ